jgi:hypothetical protein
MKKIAVLVAALILCLAILFFVSNHRNLSEIKTIKVNNHSIAVEVADTDRLRTKGLSERNSLPQNQGMLFIFPAAGLYNFWMKGMHFPLDFVWIKDDTVVDLTENVLNPKDQTHDPTEFYNPKFAVNKVLEINAGEVKKLNIKIGDKIIYNL